MARFPPTKDDLQKRQTAGLEREIRLCVLAKGTLASSWLVSEERRDRMKRRECETRGTRFKQNGSWSSKKIPDLPCLLTGTAVQQPH